jgi:hypothetical protein
MVPNVLFYQLLVIALMVICLLIHVGLPEDPPPCVPHTPRTPSAPTPTLQRTQTLHRIHRQTALRGG